MKKRINLLIISIIFFSLLILPTLKAVSDDPIDLSNVFGTNTSINPENIQKDIEDIQREYLQKEWTKFFSESQVFGPIHKFLDKISIIFKILIGYQYEISLTFLTILLLWIFTTDILYKIINSSEILKGWKAIASAIVCSTILAQLKIHYYITKSALDLIFKQQGWAFSIIVTIMVLGFLAVVYVASGILAKNLKKKAEKKKDKQKDVELKKVKSLTEEASSVKKS